MKQVILDFDGVIADTFDFHIAKINEHYNAGLTPQEYSDVHDGNFYATTNKKIVDIDFTDYPRLVSQEQTMTTPFPGAIESIVKISNSQNIHLVTSGWEMQIFPFLKYHNIYTSFKSLKCADVSTSKHEKIQQIVATEGLQPEDFIFITDTLGDIHESHAVGVPVIAVTFGFQHEERLQKGSPEYIAHSWDEIMTIVSSKNR